MNRRTVLRATTSATVPLLAGCAGRGSRTDASKTDSGGTTPSTPRVTDRSFAVIAVECATVDASPEARFIPEPPAPDAQSATIGVTGTISGNDTCHSARVEAVALDDGGEDMTVSVESYVPPENEGKACGECIVAIDYELTVMVEGARPSVVVVLHDGERVGRVPLPE